MSGIAQGIRDAGHGVIELISDFFELDQEFDILEAMAESGSCPLSFTLAEGIGGPDGWRRLLSRIEAANKNGLVIRGQVAPRAIGIHLGLTTTVNPFSGHPSYQELQHLPLAEQVQRLSDPVVKERILHEPVSEGYYANIFGALRDMKNVWKLDKKPNYEPDPQQSIATRAAAEGRDPLEYAYDVMLEDGGLTMLYWPIVNYRSQNLDVCREMLLHPHTLMGLGDGGAHVGTICDASFPTFSLIHWGRDRQRGDRIELAQLVHNQTSATAGAVGLSDRGELTIGKRGDVNVIDFDNLAVDVPRMVYDLPSGAGRLQQKSTGYLATLVAGSITYENGEATDALPGRLIRARD
jgi:N-acyl-D-aspartate/D-glutamate deacylase